MTTVPAPSPSNPETPSIPETLRELRATFDAGVTKPLRWRLEQLDALERMLREREHEFADALEADLGKSPIESFMTETSVTISEVAHLRRNLRRWLKPKHVRPNLAVAPAVTYTVRRPLGAALIIAPWNYPLQLALAPLAGAFAAGNVAVVKPSEHAPATSAALAKHIAEYLDPRAVRIVRRRRGLDRAARPALGHDLLHGRRQGRPHRRPRRRRTPHASHPRAWRQVACFRRRHRRLRRRGPPHRLGQAAQRRPDLCRA